MLNYLKRSKWLNLMAKSLSIKAVERIFNLLAFIYLVNNLDLKFVGNFFFWISILNLLSLFSLNGIQSSLIKYISTGKIGFFKKANTLSLASSSIGSIIFISFYIISFPQNDPWKFLLFFSLVFFFLGLNTWKSYYIGNEYLIKLSILNLLTVFLTNISLILLVRFNIENFDYFLFFYLFYTSIFNIIITYSIKEKSVNKKKFQKEIIFGIKSSVVDFFPSSIKELDRILIFNITGPIMLVNLNIITKFPDALKEIFRLIARYALSKISLIKNYDKKIQKKSKLLNLVTLIFLILFSFTIYPFFFKIVFDEKFFEYLFLSQIILISIFLANDSIIKNFFFKTQLNIRSYSSSVIISPILKIILSFNLIYFYELPGAVASVVLHRILNYFLISYLIKKFHK